MITPRILQALPLLLRADGAFPSVGGSEAIRTAVNDAAAGEAHKFWIQGLESLSQIAAQAVSVISITRNQGDIVNVNNWL